MNILQFMSNSPFLTFFLALILTSCVVSVVRALRGVPEHCDGCKCDLENEPVEK